MDSSSLYNLAPVARVMGMGLILAALPLAWLWLRRPATAGQRAHRLGELTLLVLFLTFDLVLFGAFTRLTDSGLGCPDWPGCYGFGSPVGADQHISAAQLAMPTGPVTLSKAWIEMVHRYLATGVGVLIIVLTVATLRMWWRQRRAGAAEGPWVMNPLWSVATLVWVCAQGAFGALTVTMKLFPAIVTLHLLGAMGLLVLLMIQAESYRQRAGDSQVQRVTTGVRALLWLAVLLVVLQTALGGWVSTNYAVLACDTFPKCQGSWWPHMNFAQGFELWRPLGRTGDGALLVFAALTAIHYVHRLVAYGVLALLLAVVLVLRARALLPVQRRWLLALLLLQLLTGLSNVILDWPILAALLHTGGAAAIIVVLTWSLCVARIRVPRGAAPAHVVT